MRSERIVVLVSPKEKRELKELAGARSQSVGDYVRTAVLAPGRSTASDDSTVISAEQRAALEEAASRAAAALKRGNEALDRAFAEIARTRAHFNKAAKTRKAKAG
jgi:hypothetical protein